MTAAIRPATGIGSPRRGISVPLMAREADLATHLDRRSDPSSGIVLVRHTCEINTWALRAARDTLIAAGDGELRERRPVLARQCAS